MDSAIGVGIARSRKSMVRPGSIVACALTGVRTNENGACIYDSIGNLMWILCGDNEMFWSIGIGESDDGTAI